MGSADPSITMLSPLSAPWGVGLFARFFVPHPHPSPLVLPLLRTEQERKACGRAVLAFQAGSAVISLPQRSADSEDCGSG